MEVRPLLADLGTDEGIAAVAEVCAAEPLTMLVNNAGVAPRMSADDVVTACLRGLELGEVVCSPGVEDATLLDAVFAADMAAFTGQSTELASRYRP